MPAGFRYTDLPSNCPTYPMPDGVSPNAEPAVLSASEPAPFRVMNPDADAPILLICDHASRRFPASLGNMGLDPFARRCHLAIDIGAGDLTDMLAERLGVTAVLANYSRLVIDCNRQLLDPSCFLEYGDGILVPGNGNLSNRQKQARAEEIYWPYHYAVETEVQRLCSIGPPPAFITVHSFTPVLSGVSRPWQMGVLWDKDQRLSNIFLEDFTAAGYHVGNNEPYSGKAPQDFTIDHHAENAGLPHVGLEIRQDLIDDRSGVERIAALMEKIILSIPDRIGLHEHRASA